MKHILVIEDEALIRDEIVILLEKAGYQVDMLTDFKDTSQQVLQYLLACIFEVSQHINLITRFL